MIKTIKKNKELFLVIGLSLLILTFIFLIKGIYPFGTNSIIMGDLYGQITPYYYYLHDCIRGSSSIFINFTSSNGVNFFGILSYYLLNPLSLLVVFVNREKMYLFISIIVALKIIFCNVTCLLMMKRIFKKINYKLSVLLALLYGFSAFSLTFYQITSWIDVMYMLPIIVLGLYKLFEEDDFKLYILSLTLSLYFSFYLLLMIIIWIFLLSGLYIYVYKKKDFGKKILSLGIGTILSIGNSLIIILPSYKQISISSRMSSGFSSIINSGLGPLTDKIALFIFGPVLFAGLILLIKNHKKYRKFLTFYVMSMILLLLPVVVEPINKLLHFGSYASFPYRFGLVTTLFIIIGCAYIFNCEKEVEDNTNNLKKILSVVITIFSSLVIVAITILKSKEFFVAINKLTLSSNKMLIIILGLMFIIAFLSIIAIYFLNKGINKFSILLIFLLTIVHITCNSFIYLGNPIAEKQTKDTYVPLNDVYEDYKDKDTIYRYKVDGDIELKNSGLVTKLPTMDHFSSLTDLSNQETLKLLGYSSYWTHTHSNGGTLFTDILLGNKYYLSDDEKIENYSLKKKYGNYYLHEYNYDISYGYLLNKNVKIDRNKNTFEIQNDIYNSITDDNNLFKMVEDVTYNNVDKKDNTFVAKKGGSIEYNVKVNESSRVYLELLGTLNNGKNIKIFKSLNIYLNNKLYLENYPSAFDNGLIDFGGFKDELINVKVEFLSDCSLEKVGLGIMNLNKLNNFRDNFKVNYDLKLVENNINIKINSDEEKILFIPISNNDSYTLINNNKKAEIINVYDNYIGIKLNEGINDIKITFIPSLLKPSAIISLISLIITLALIKFRFCNSMLNNKKLQIIAQKTYKLLYILVILGIFILPAICFVISFIK